MQSPFVYHPRFFQNECGIYERYNNYQIPNKYVYRPSNYNNYLFTGEEDSHNYKSFKVLTDKNLSLANQGYTDKLLTKGEEDKSFQSSQNLYKQFNCLAKTIKKIENNNNNLNRNKDLNSAKNDMKENIENIDLNSNNIYNLYEKGIKINKTNNNIFNQNFSSLFIDSDNQKYKLNNSSTNIIKNDSYIGQYQSLKKNKNNSKRILIMKNIHKINNNNLNKENNRKAYYEEKSPFNKINNNINYESKLYIEGIYNTIKEEGKGKENNNNFNNLTDRPKFDDNFKRNMTDNYINNNINNNSKKIVKNIKKSDNNILDKKESKTYQPQKNKNISQPKIESFDIGNTIIKKEDEMKNKLNSLNKLQIKKDNNDNINNNTFNEINYITKEYKSQKNLIINTKVNNKLDKSQINFKKMNSNKINMKEKIDLNTRKANLKEGNKGTPKYKIDFINKSAQNSKLKFLKNNLNNTNPNIYNNIFTINEKVKVNIPLNNNNYLEKINEINKNIFSERKKKNNNNHFIDINNINKRFSQSEFSQNPTKIDVLKIYSNCFTYFPIRKTNIIKSKKSQKFKKSYNKKRFILLLNINNKTFEEDFLLNKKFNTNFSKNTLIPQISFRITLFAKKEPEYRKYFIVNKIYSQNIRDKSTELESDF